MIKDRRIALIYRIACFVFCVAGILGITGTFKGAFSIKLFMYYTLQSNVLVLVMFGFFIVKTALLLKKEGKNGNCGNHGRFSMVCSVDIFITFMVYWVLLVPQTFAMDGGFKLFSFENLAVHAITPILCILDYLFFVPSRHLKYKDVYLTVIFPLAYFVVVSVVGACGYVFTYDSVGVPVHYPYFFIDYDRIGAMAAVYVLALVAIFLSISHALYWLDKKWNKPNLFPRIASENETNINNQQEAQCAATKAEPNDSAKKE